MPNDPCPSTEEEKNALNRDRNNKWLRKLPDIIILLLTYIAVMLALEFLDFKLYIKFLLGSSKLVLMAFGYPVSISSNVLAGDYGSVSLAKSCLGLVTIYISASNKTKALLYILVGIIILNLINILRIILLFVHLQKYGDYMLTMDSHDIYNYVIYGIIFILWVIWFEFYYSHKVKGNHIFSK